MKQFIVGVLITIVLGAAAIGLYNANRAEANDAAPVGIAAQNGSGADETVVQPSAASNGGQPAAGDVAAALPAPQVESSGGAAALSAPDAPPTTTLGQGNRFGQQGTQGGYGQQSGTTGTPQVMAQTHMTTTFTETGTIQAVEQTGLSLVTTAGAPLWVQLGQSRFWQSQAVTFTVGDLVTVTGFYENDQFQAVTVQNKTTAQSLALRDATGRPLWAGGRGRGGQH